jgi:hypothetical protein
MNSNLIIAVVVLLLCIGGYFYYKKSQADTVAATAAATAATAATAAAAVASAAAVARSACVKCVTTPAGWSYAQASQNGVFPSDSLWVAGRKCLASDGSGVVDYSRGGCITSGGLGGAVGLSACNTALNASGATCPLLIAP